MSATVEKTRAAGVRPRRTRHNVLRVGVWRTRFELMQYFRSGDTLFFTFLFPVFMLGLFSVAFGSDGDVQIAPGVPPRRLSMPSDRSIAMSMARFWNPDSSRPAAIMPGRYSSAIEIGGTPGAICTSPSEPNATLNSPSMKTGKRNVCLLYTSPSPRRDSTRTRGASSGSSSGAFRPKARRSC